MMTRREVLRTAASTGALAALQGLLPAWASIPDGLQGPELVAESREFDLVVGRTAIQIDGRQSVAVTVNGSMPAPLLRFRAGETVTLRVRNELDEPTSIHWHGILLPFEMDGVPGVTFPWHSARRDVRLPLSGHAERHLLVPQPHRPAGAARAPRAPDRRSCRDRSLSRTTANTSSSSPTGCSRTRTRYSRGSRNKADYSNYPATHGRRFLPRRVPERMSVPPWRTA